MIADMGPSCNAEEIISRLVSEYQETLLRMCMMYCHDRMAAEDAVQETFLKAYRALPKFRGECSEKTWLMRIALNVCRDATRTDWFRHTDRRVTPDDLPLASEAAPADEKEELAQAILQLPRKYKDALLLYYYQYMTMDEAAKALGTSSSNLSKRLKRAREKLRVLLERGAEQ